MAKPERRPVQRRKGPEADPSSWAQSWAEHQKPGERGPSPPGAQALHCARAGMSREPEVRAVC